MPAEFENSVTVIMSNITKLIQVLTVQHKEVMDEQAKCHQEQMDEQIRQSWDQDMKHAEQMSVLMEQVKVKEVEMKHLIESACDGAKGSSSPVANFQAFDSS